MSTFRCWECGQTQTGKPAHVDDSGDETMQFCESCITEQDAEHVRQMSRAIQSTRNATNHQDRGWTPCAVCGADTEAGTVYEAGWEVACPECGAQKHLRMDGHFSWYARTGEEVIRFD